MKGFFTLFLLTLLFPISSLAQSSISSVINHIASIIETIATVAATLVIVIGGFQWMTSAGDPSKIERAKDKIYSAILGLLIIALAKTIAYLLGGKIIKD